MALRNLKKEMAGADITVEAVADALKKQCKKNTELAAIYFTVTVE